MIDCKEKPCKECVKDCPWFQKDLKDWIDELWLEETYGKSLGG